MGYRIENNHINLEGKKSKKIATGKTGDVYKYGKEAVKIFDNDKSLPIDEESARELTRISSTRRILLPRKLVFYDDAFSGYTLKLVSRERAGRRMISQNISDIISNVEQLERDVEIVSARKVLLNGISPENVLNNGRLYLTDPSKYRLLDVKTTDRLLGINMYQLHVLITEIMTGELKICNFSEEEINALKEIMKKKELDQRTSEYLFEIAEDEENIKTLVRRLKDR